MTNKPEPVYVDLYQKKPISKKKQRQQRQDRLARNAQRCQGENDLDFALLEMFGKSSFTYPKDRKRWHNITYPVYNLRNPERDLYRAWVEKLIEWGEGKNIYAVMSACENTESWNDFKAKNKESFQTEEQKAEVESAVAQLETEDDFDG